MKLRALSVRQPDAGLLATGEKTIEVRCWRTHYRGPLVIVSSARPVDQGPAGCALALVRLLAVEPMRARDWRAACMLSRRDWSPDLFSWHVELLGALPRRARFAVKGKLNIYGLDIPERARAECARLLGLADFRKVSES